MKCRGCRQHGARIQAGLPAIEIGKHTTGLGDDDAECGDIKNVDVRFDDCIKLTRGETVIMVVIAITTCAIRICKYSAKCGPTLACGEALDVASRNARLPDSVHSAN